MAFVPWDEGAKVIMNWTSLIHGWANVFAFTKPSFVYADMVDLGNTLWGGLRTSYKNFMSDLTGLASITVIDMRAFGAQSYTTGAPTQDGLNIEEMLSLQDAVVATLRTLGRGRSFRGRKYMAGFTEDDLTDGIWSAALISEIEDQLDAWKVLASQFGWTLCIASEQINKVPKSPAVLTPVTTISVRNSLPGSQRRRVGRP